MRLALLALCIVAAEASLPGNLGVHSLGGSNRHFAASRLTSSPRRIQHIKPLRGGNEVSAELQKPLLVIGSLNVDIIIEVDRLPHKDETIVARNPNTGSAVAGGKGANQAVAAAKLSAGSGRRVQFVCQFGNDAHTQMLKDVLTQNGVDISLCGSDATKPSGQGFVLLEADGAVSSVVVGGANVAWTEEHAYALKDAIGGAGAVLLQREIPEQINEIVAKLAHEAGVPVMQDVGGEDRPISDSLLKILTYISPNLTELRRLTMQAVETDDDIIKAAKSLQARGAQNVLVTLGGRGSILVTADDQVLKQEVCAVPGGRVLDATGAGDAFRAAFAVALAERHRLQDCLRFAAAAGAVTASRLGAVPSLPSRQECSALIAVAPVEHIRGGVPILDADDGIRCGGHVLKANSAGAVAALRGGEAGRGNEAECPMEFGSRLNSMKDRLDLWDGPNDVLGWVARQGAVKGLDLVDFNYPQHLGGMDLLKVQEALAGAGLKTGAICLRFPKEMQLGAYTHPDPAMRKKAIKLTLEACKWAEDLGAGEVVVWSAFDGYDYSLQVDYTELWAQVVGAFQEICDAFPNVKVSLEYKPTDENTRFFTVPSTGAAMLLVQDIDRANMGLTLDVGHCLAAGENPAQSVAMVGQRGKLFGMQLNDGYQRLGAEDGLMFGSVHPRMALELVYWLRKTQYKGHVYFDTFPRNEDPVREAEYNIRRFKKLWQRAAQLEEEKVERLLAKHDAVASLELLEQLGID